MKDKHDKLLKEIYPIKMELEELSFMQPRLLEIVNFYFDRYGFGIKNTKPKIMIKFEKEYDVLTLRFNKLKKKYFELDNKIKELDAIKQEKEQ